MLHVSKLLRRQLYDMNRTIEKVSRSELRNRAIIHHMFVNLTDLQLSSSLREVRYKRA